MFIFAISSRSANSWKLKAEGLFHLKGLEPCLAIVQNPSKAAVEHNVQDIVVNVARSTMELVKFRHIQYNSRVDMRDADCGVTAGVLQGDYEVTAWTPTNRVSSQHVLLFLLVFCSFFYPIIIIIFTIIVLEEI